MSEPRQSAVDWGREAVLLLPIMLTAALVRLAFAWQYTRHPLGQYPWVDEASYWTWAQAILRGEWWPIRPFYQDPLYPYWLACLMGVLGTEPSSLRIASAGMGALTPAVVAWAGRAGLGRAEGLLAGWATALYAPLIFADGSLEKEGLAAFWTALALGLTAHLLRRERPWLGGAAGAAWGVVGLLRSNALLVPALGVCWLVPGGAGTERPERGGGWTLVALFLAGCGLVVIPVVAVNTAVSRPRELLGTTWQAGPNFYIGNGPEATGTYTAPPFVRANPAYEAADYAVEAMRRCGRALSPGQVSGYWLGEGLKQWRREPLRSVRLLGWKFALLTHRFEIPDSQDLEFVRIVAAPSLRWGIVDFGLLFPLAVVGLAWVPRTRFWWFLTSATGVGLAATAVFFVVGRYRVPWVPGLALLAAVGAIDLARCWRIGHWRGLAWRLGALALPAALLSWRPQADPTPYRWGNQLIALGLAELRAGRLDQAVDAFDLARAFDPQTADRVQAILTNDPVHALMARSVADRLGQESDDGPANEMTIRRCRLLRQSPERRREAMTKLESILLSAPDHPGACRELGAYFLSWPDRPDSRARAIELLVIASHSPGGDLAASLLLALATSDPAYLRIPGAASTGAHERSVTLVTAILAPRIPRGETRRSRPTLR
jgi:hypothetical protein